MRLFIYFQQWICYSEMSSPSFPSVGLGCRSLSRNVVLPSDYSLCVCGLASFRKDTSYCSWVILHVIPYVQNTVFICMLQRPWCHSLKEEMAVDSNFELFGPICHHVPHLLFLLLLPPFPGEPGTSAGEGMSLLNKRPSKHLVSKTHPSPSTSLVSIINISKASYSILWVHT